MPFKEINPKDISFPLFKFIGDEWMLITAGNKDSVNTMTASWGGAGVLWNKPVAFSFVRPQRYTFEFMEKEQYFTLSFFYADMKQALKVCGSKSGRDIDKIKETGLIPQYDLEAPYFQQAKMVLVCKKLYGQFIKPEFFINEEIKDFYPNKDYHKMYIGEIVRTLIRI